MDGITEAILEEAEDFQLVELHNLIPGVRPVTRLGDRTTAKARIRLALERAGCRAARVTGRPTVYRVVPQDAATRPRERRIRVLVSENPKRSHGKSYHRFNLYRDGMTVGEYLDLATATGISLFRARMDVYTDRDHGFIALEE
jgi:hypothetical protein